MKVIYLTPVIPVNHVNPVKIDYFNFIRTAKVKWY